MSSDSRRSARASPGYYDPQTNSFLLSKVPREVRLMIWELVFTGNDLLIEQTRAPVLLERLEPKKRKYHWFPLKSTFLGRISKEEDPLHAWKIAKQLSNGAHLVKGESRSITALLLTCRAIYQEASYVKHRIFSGNNLHFVGTTALEQFCRTVPNARLLGNPWTIYPDSNLRMFLVQIKEVDHSLSSRTFTHRFEDPFAAFASELWSQVDRRAYGKYRTVKTLLSIKDLPEEPFSQSASVRVLLGTLKDVPDESVRRKRDFGICFQIESRAQS